MTSLNLVDDERREEDAVEFETVVTHSSRETAVTGREQAEQGAAVCPPLGQEGKRQGMRVCDTGKE